METEKKKHLTFGLVIFIFNNNKKRSAISIREYILSTINIFYIQYIYIMFLYI